MGGTYRDTLGHRAILVTPANVHLKSEFYKISRGAGLEFDMFPQYAGLLEQAGFVNIKTHEEPTPIGTWPKDRRLKQIGLFFELQFLEGAVDGYSLALFTRLGGWSEAETQVLLAQVRQETKSKKMHLYTHW